MFRYITQLEDDRTDIYGGDFTSLIDGTEWGDGQTGIWFVKSDFNIRFVEHMKNEYGVKIGRFDDILRMFFIHDRPVIVSDAECGEADIVFRGYL